MLPRSHRLARTRDIERASRQGRPVHAPHLTLRAVPNTVGVMRATVIAGLKVSKRAVVRNRVKRVLREALRRHLAAIRRDADVVIHVKPAAVGVPYRTLAAEVGQCLFRARALAGPWVDALGKSEKIREDSR